MRIRKMLVVDDHPVVLEGLRVVLTAEGYDVFTAVSMEMAIALVESNVDIGLLIVDLTLRKDADGLELIRKIRTRRPGIPAIVYTMHEELWNISALVDADVEGVVLKGEKIDELLEAVRLVGKGAIYRSPEFCERFDSVRKAKGILSQTDRAVLRLISEGMQTSEISDKINLSEKSIEYHRSNIIKKLGTKNMTEAIRNAVKLGIISCMAVAMPSVLYAEESAPTPVDLGLSVKWSDRNLGAKSPLESGAFFSFGETTTKENYDWDTYIHCDHIDGEMDMFIQHNIGEESICGTEYDAAHVELGEGWRMPSEEEMAELVSSCELEYVEAEPLNYLKVIAGNGEYIELPIAGYMTKTRLYQDNKELTLWTGSFYVDAGEEDGFAYYMNSPTGLGYSKKAGANLIEISVHLGLPIRPVYDGSMDVISVTHNANVNSVYSIDGRVLSSESSLAPGIYIIGGKKTIIR